jgi:hypothetical protein
MAAGSARPHLLLPYRLGCGAGRGPANSTARAGTSVRTRGERPPSSVSRGSPHSRSLAGCRPELGPSRLGFPVRRERRRGRPLPSSPQVTRTSARNTCASSASHRPRRRARARQMAVLPQGDHTFRAFVRSTLTDFGPERNALQEGAFPRLQECCERRGCRSQAIDLRWRASREASLDQRTISVCLKEIRRRQHVTPRPNAVALLDQRYGWRPEPAQIPAAEFEQILGNVSVDERESLLWRDDRPQSAKGCTAKTTTLPRQSTSFSRKPASVRTVPCGARQGDRWAWSRRRDTRQVRAWGH